eukprot:GHVU01113030.1.p2 GENE.GHVU01113030.1~~GHVU01113030.1.p2  ORF type:complete len:111 (-),score=12.52 GHVU01113030.1:1117-1449(-)
MGDEALLRSKHAQHQWPRPQRAHTGAKGEEIEYAKTPSSYSSSSLSSSITTTIMQTTKTRATPRPSAHAHMPVPSFAPLVKWMEGRADGLLGPRDGRGLPSRNASNPVRN